MLLLATAEFKIQQNERAKKSQEGRSASGPPLLAFARYFRSCSAGLQGKNNGKKHMMIVYREELIDGIAEEIKNLDFARLA